MHLRIRKSSLSKTFLVETEADLDRQEKYLQHQEKLRRRKANPTKIIQNSYQPLCRNTDVTVYPDHYTLDFLALAPADLFLDPDWVYLRSPKYKFFSSKELVCVTCGLKAEFLKKEKSLKTGLFSLGIYGVDELGEDILFTRDHIIPKRFGGTDRGVNLQVMCEPCNIKKGSKIAWVSLTEELKNPYSLKIHHDIAQKMLSVHS